MRNFIVALCMILILGCSSTGTPVLPGSTSGDDLTNSTNTARNLGKISLGLYNVKLDPVSQTAEIVPVRSAKFRANITVFLQPPLGLPGWVSFSNFDITDFETEGIIRLDIAVTHPFEGVMDLRCFDTTCVFMSGASFTPDIPSGGVIPRQDGSDARIINADGYTRWNNAIEFTADNIFGYFEGIYGIPGFTPTGTINGYKYHCSGIGSNEDIVDFFSNPANVDRRGSFAPGAVSKRRYEVQFPDPAGELLFQLNVLTSWNEPSTSVNPEISDFPLDANQMEPFLLDVDTSESTVFYVDETTKGGSIHLVLNVHDWQSMEGEGGGIPVDDGISAIYVDSFNSSFIGIPENLKPLATVEPHGEVSLTYTVDIESVNPTSAGIEWLVVVVESADPDTYNQGFPVPIPSAALSAYVITQVSVISEGNLPPDVGNITGETAPNEADIEDYSVDVTDPEGDPLTIEWSLVSDGNAPIWGNIGSNSDTISIDWCVYGGGDFDLHCHAKDDYHGFWVPASNDPLDISVVLNQSPSVGEISGETNPFETNVEEYSISALDPEGHPLSYEWSLVIDGQPVDWGNVGSDNDTITIDWNDYGIGDYDLHCRVKDTCSDWQLASNNPLDITVIELNITCGNGVYGYFGYAWSQCQAVEPAILSDGSVVIEYGYSFTVREFEMMRINYEWDVGGYCYTVGNYDACDDDWCELYDEVFFPSSDPDNRSIHMDTDFAGTYGSGSETDDVVAFVMSMQPSIVRFLSNFNNTTEAMATEIATKTIPTGTVLAIDFNEDGDLWVLDSTGRCYELTKASDYSVGSENFTVDMGTVAPGATVIFDWVISYLYGDLFIFTDQTTGGTLHKISGSTGSVIGTVSNALDAGVTNPAYGLGTTDARGDIEIDHRVFSGENPLSEHCRLVISGGPGGTGQAAMFARYDQALNLLSTWDNNQTGGGSCNNPLSDDGGRFIIFDPVDHVNDPGQPGDEEAWDHTMWVGDAGTGAGNLVWASSSRPCPDDWDGW